MCLKKCNKCKEQKEYSEFAKNKNSKDGHKNICKICDNKRRKEMNSSIAFRIKKELNKITRVENGMLKESSLMLCCGCRAEIDLSDKNYYCKSCQKEQRERDKEKVLASKKAYRDRNKEKQKAYRDSRKELQREYDARRYQLKKEEISRKAKERYKKRKLKEKND